MKSYYLKSVFWDYPEFEDEKRVFEMKNSGSKDKYNWILTRFLEYARVIDTFHFFTIEEIKTSFKDLKLKKSTLEKWNRLIEVYGRN